MSDEKLVIARFLKNGCAYHIESGKTLARGTNVIYHPTYWDVPMSWVRATAMIHDVRFVIENSEVTE